MFDNFNLFNRNSIFRDDAFSEYRDNPIEKTIASMMVNECSVSNILSDSVSLIYPQAMGGIPTNLSGIKTPTQQIIDVGQKYNIPYTGDINSYQTRVVKALIMHKAMEYGVPLNIALGVAGNESGWKMWSNIEKGTLVKCVNSGSTDWGAMQLNDNAHKKVFPRAKQDLEYNVDYGMKFLANRINSIKGSLKLGFGEWDRAVASYNLGHNPSSKRDYEIAQKYVSRVKKQSLAVGDPTS
jgi:hypothetical protein